MVSSRGKILTQGLQLSSPLFKPLDSRTRWACFLKQVIGPLLTDLVIRHLLDVDMGPIEDVQPCVPVLFYTQGAPGPWEEGEGGEQLLTALLERVI